MNYAFILPTAYMSIVARDTFHMCLVDECMKNADYLAKCEALPGYKILDNSFYELGYSIKLDTLVQYARKIHARCIVLPDDEFSGAYDPRVAAAYDVMLVPHSLDTLQKALDVMRDVGFENSILGISHIGASRMLGKKMFGAHNRANVVDEVIRRVDERERRKIKIHFLGGGDDYFSELKLLNKMSQAFHSFSTDSSLFLAPFLNSGGLLKFENIKLKSKAGAPIDFKMPFNANLHSKCKIEFERVKDLLQM